MDGKQFMQALDGEVNFSALHTPVMHTRQVVVIREALGTCVAFFLPELPKFLPDFLQCFVNRFFFHRPGFCRKPGQIHDLPKKI